MILALAFVLARIGSGIADLELNAWAWRALSGRPVVYAWLTVAVLFFVYFYPVWTGLPIGDQQYLGGFGHGRMWFLKWI